MNVSRGSRIAFLLLAVVGVLLVAACGDGDDDDGVAPDQLGVTSAATSAPATTVRETAGPTPPPGPAPADLATGERSLYLALGDSLSEGVGASDPKRTAWVPLVATALPQFDLVNLGVGGDTSQELIDNRLQFAVQTIRLRAEDTIPGNEVALITLEIGGNDLLDIYFELVVPGTCPTVPEALANPVCVDAFQSALDNYRPNLEFILDELQAQAPGVPIFLMTLYNPFSGAAETLDRISVLALEGEEGTPFPEGLNDTIRAVAAEKAVHLVEWYEPFIGKQPEYIAADFIHPNDTGYQVMADAVLAALADAGIP